MRQEELEDKIAEIIIPSEKPKSTGNSHRRKQWENRKNWRILQSSPHGPRLITARIVANIWKGVFYNVKTGRIKKISYTYCAQKRIRKWNKKIDKRTVRRYKFDIPNGCAYKMIFSKHVID